IGQFLRLRNIPRWYPPDPKGGDKRNEEAKANVETLISKISAAVEKELGNADRIRRYANNLSGSPEESAFALNELRRSGKAVPPVLAPMLTDKLTAAQRAGILRAIPLLGADTVPGFVADLPHADAAGQPGHNVWVWDGKTVRETPMTRAQATEYYGLRYARWALDIQLDYAKAQRVFFGIAIEHLAMRAGGRPLPKVAPDLYAALA